MEFITTLKIRAIAVLCLTSALLVPAVRADVAVPAPSLAGTWSLVAADVLHADVARGRATTAPLPRAC